MSGLTFQLQSGIRKKTVTVSGSEISIRDLREISHSFIEEIYPDHEWGDSLRDHLLLYKHDLRSINILQLVTTSSDIADGTLVEVVITACAQQERLVVHPHTLFVHSYKSPAFCDFCGEMLFGLVKQGLKCQGCGLNYHKRCASKVPNNCNGSRQRRPSAIPLSPKNSANLVYSLTGTFNNQTGPQLTSTPMTNAGGGLSPQVGGGPRHSPSINQLTTLAVTPDIYVTSEREFAPGHDDTGDNSYLQMPRKDRSSSWSGRPLWMEVADANRVKVPHTFEVHSYKRPTMCQYCKKLLKGLIRQGVQCRDCKYNCHKKCVEQVAKDCSGNASSQFFLGAGEDKSSFAGSSDSLRMSSVPFDSDADEMETTGTSVDDSGLRMRGQKKQQQRRGMRGTPSAPLTPGAPDSGIEMTTPGSMEDDDLNESQNIPLMRIVMSKKQTKRPSTKAIKEGWMVHFTDNNSMRKKHYWRLDTKCLVMYQDETSNRYYKEIPLNEIFGLKVVMASSDDDTVDLPKENQQNQQRAATDYCFEIKTKLCVYYVAEPCSEEEREEKREKRVAGEDWYTAVKQALMPVTPQGSNSQKKGAQQNELLKVPQGTAAAVTGQLGLAMQSEQEFSQLFQIYTDEVLGSGQFGTVYGGVHRKSGKHVAVKVIDKLKFPSNKEAALRTEVDILQKVRHGGVVEFEQMLETADRIFVVMEKLKGDMLEMILSSEKGRLSERITRFIVHQILISLRYLHSQNIVHCDLKPENILLVTESDFPQVKLCDFGFARIIGEKSFRRSVVGTPAYLAPEVLRNKGFNRSLDMWSVGVIVYVSLSGTFPFNEDEDINDQIQNAEFMYPPNPWSEVSAEAIDFINAVLQVKMSKRLTVGKALNHVWLQTFELWSDLRRLEKAHGERYLTCEADDVRYAALEYKSSDQSKTATQPPRTTTTLYDTHIQ